GGGLRHTRARRRGDRSDARAAHAGGPPAGAQRGAGDREKAGASPQASAGDRARPARSGAHRHPAQRQAAGAGADRRPLPRPVRPGTPRGASGRPQSQRPEPPGRDHLPPAPARGPFVALHPPTTAQVLTAAPPRTSRPAVMVAAGIFLSRILGLVRNRVFAHYFGTSDAADAFNAAFRIPNFLQNLFGE